MFYLNQSEFSQQPNLHNARVIFAAKAPKVQTAVGKEGKKGKVFLDFYAS